MVRALGGLFTFLLNNKIVNELEDSSTPIHINSIIPIST